MSCWEDVHIGKALEPCYMLVLLRYLYYYRDELYIICDLLASAFWLLGRFHTLKGPFTKCLPGKRLPISFTLLIKHGKDRKAYQ